MGAVVLRPLGSLAKLGERRDSGSGFGPAAKWGLEISVHNEVSFDLDELKTAAIMGQAIEDAIRHNMSHGMAPDGTPLPTASAATVQRRAYRREQIARGADQLRLSRRALASRIANTRDTKAANSARGERREIRRRFKASSTKGSGPQGTWLPTDPTTFGHESGLMAASAKAVIVPPSTVRIYFADKRGSFADPRTGETAVHRVFKRVPIWNPRAMHQDRIRKALTDVTSAIVRTRASKAIGSAAQALGGVLDLAAQLEDVGTED